MAKVASFSRRAISAVIAMRNPCMAEAGAIGGKAPDSNSMKAGGNVSGNYLVEADAIQACKVSPRASPKPLAGGRLRILSRFQTIGGPAW